MYDCLLFLSGSAFTALLGAFILQIVDGVMG
jgi:hypothetical protein